MRNFLRIELLARFYNRFVYGYVVVNESGNSWRKFVFCFCRFTVGGLNSVIFWFSGLEAERNELVNAIRSNVWYCVSVPTYKSSRPIKFVKQNRLDQPSRPGDITTLRLGASSFVISSPSFEPKQVNSLGNLMVQEHKQNIYRFEKVEKNLRYLGPEF